MKPVVVAVIAIAFAGAAFFILDSSRPAAISPAAVPDARSGRDTSDGQLARLSAQVEALQRRLNTVQSQLTARETPLAAAAQDTTKEPEPAQSPDIEEERAREAEEYRQYMAGIVQAFAGQKIDPAWANRASSRVDAVFGDDETLRNLTRNVECRERTCRVEIEDDGTGRLNTRMPLFATGLADVLPNISAERVDRGNGRSTMVLYLSSEPAVQGSAR